MLWNNPNIKSGVEKVQGAVGKPEDIAAAVGTENYVASRWSSNFRIARFVSSGFSCWIQ